MPFLQSQDKDMNRLIPTYPFPARKYTPVYLPTQPMEEEAQCRDNRHQEETDNLQHEDDSTKYHRDDKAVEEDECEHDEFCLRVNDDVCNLLIFIQIYE